ncbi:MAG: TonB-dependent receptor [Alphaproteobacteria bacterium]|nr:TonB-dependent receptor [Alphaproteobacteria bacterium]
MSFIRLGASALSLTVSMFGPSAIAQTPATGPGSDVVAVGQPAKPDAPVTERVVVTGSLIRGTPENASLPVEIFTAEDLEESGAPTALEFVKQLSISGPTQGEANFTAGAGLTNRVQVNLRGLGVDKTLTLLNGRRVSDNTSNIPAAAIGRIEILKDGAAVTYGADATGGVINYITRKSFNGLEVKGQYKYIADSDGDYGLSVLGGFGEGEANFLWSAEWEHRSRLETEERSFSSLPYDINPSSWTTSSELAGWTPRGTLPASPGNTAAAEFGTALSATPVADFTPASCAAVGGAYVNTSTCSYWSTPYLNLLEETDIYRVYTQVNWSISDSMDLHVEASYGQVLAPEVYGSPAFPLSKGPARATGSADQIYVPSTNPFVAEFAGRSGWATNAAFASTRGYTARSYRPLGHGGNPLYGQNGNGFGGPISIDTQVFRTSGGLDGELPASFGFLQGIHYDFATTYNQTINRTGTQDFLGFRLQEALSGFGGPNCRAADLDPLRFGTQNPAAAGVNGCQWWNPFASSFASQPELGLPNPNYIAGTENSIELIRWMYGDDQYRENINTGLIVDLVFDGETPVPLPGGNIALAGGVQWRQTENREVVSSAFRDGRIPCEWPANFTGGVNGVPVAQTPRATNDPLFNGCTLDNPGPFVFGGTSPAQSSDQQQYSFFGEASLPVLDTLNLVAAVRREEFSSDLGATVYKVSGKWDVFGPFSLRASYGTNYQAPPAGLIPGRITNGVTGYTKLGGAFAATQTVTVANIKPETATVWNIGALWQSRGFTDGSDFKLFIDYFDFETQDEIGTIATVQDIAAVVFPGANSAATLANCSHPLVGRVLFNGGNCTQGVTAARDFASIRTDLGNGPGQHTAGFDVQSEYSMPIGPGEGELGLTATYVTVDENEAPSLDGFQFSSDDRLGFRNFATSSFSSPALRVNVHANYRLANHNLRLAVNYVSGVEDERGPITPGGLTTPTDFGVAAEDWIVGDLHYILELPSAMRLTASIGNILDQDPPPSREQFGFDGKFANPLGRTFEVGLKKTF